MMLDVTQLNIRRECPTETYFVYQEQINCCGFSVTLFLFSCFIWIFPTNNFEKVENYLEKVLATKLIKRLLPYGKFFMSYK